VTVHEYFRLYYSSRTRIQEEIKGRLKSGNACYHSVQNLSSSSFLSKIIKVKIYRTIILPVMYGCETWSLTLWKERRLGVFEKRVLRRIFGPKRDEVTGEWRKLHNEKLNDLYRSPNIIRVIKLIRMRWVGHVARAGEKEVHTRFWWGSLTGRDQLGDSSVGGRIILNWIFRKWAGRSWTGLNLAEVRGRWWALVDAVMNLRIP